MSDQPAHTPARRLSWRRLRALTVKETRQLLRDKSNLMVGLFLPVVLILVFGYGLSFDIKNAPVAIVTDDTSPTAQDVVAGFYLSPVLFRDAAALDGRGATLDARRQG